MNKTIDNQVLNAEGRYLVDTELSAFHDFCTNYALRSSTYNYLQEHGDALILKALRSLMSSHRQVIQQHSDICKRDMSCVLRQAAVSILKDDEDGFVEELVLWMQNIMFALRKEEQSIEFYVTLQKIIQEQMAPNQAALVNHYLTVFIEALKVGKG